MPLWHRSPFYTETFILAAAPVPAPSLYFPPGSRAAEIAARPQQPESSDPLIVISFEVRRSKAPALRSAVDEISNIVGARIEGKHRFSKEFALTDAAITLGALRAAVNRSTPAGDPNYV